jgi:guanylate kinase
MTAPAIIISGPSGIGKSSVIARLLETCRYPLRMSISATTRAPRKGEKEGQHYHYWNVEQFQQGIRENRFLEWARVYEKDYYGTLIEEVEPFRNKGIGVVLEIDVQGAAQVREKLTDTFSVFLLAPLSVYESRLRSRGTETEEAIQRRLRAAQTEIPRMKEYNLTLVNDNLGRTYTG